MPLCWILWCFQCTSESVQQTWETEKGGKRKKKKNDQRYKMVSSQKIKQLTFQVENNLSNMISVTAWKMSREQVIAVFCKMTIGRHSVKSDLKRTEKKHFFTQHNSIMEFLPQDMVERNKMAPKGTVYTEALLLWNTWICMIQMQPLCQEASHLWSEKDRRAFRWRITF